MEDILQFIRSHHTLDDVRSTFPNANVHILELITEALAYCHADELCDELYEESFMLLELAINKPDGDNFNNIDLNSFHRQSKDRVLDKLVTSSNPLVHVLCMMLYGLQKGIESAEQYEQGVDYLASFGEASEAIAHARLFSSVMTRLEDEEDYHKRIQFLESDTKRHRGGRTTAKNLQETQAGFYELAESIANQVWHVHTHISHNNMATLIKDAIHAKYSIPDIQTQVPAIRELSSRLEKLAPNDAPKRQQMKVLYTESNYNNIIKTINNNLP